MFEQYKQVFTEKYNNEITKFNELREKLDEYERIMREDESEENYNNSIKALNKKYGIFKRGKEYQNELNNLKEEFTRQLKEYENTYNEYVKLKSEAAKISIYNIQKKLEQLMNANSLEDLRLTEEAAIQAIEQVNMEEL